MRQSLGVQPSDEDGGDGGDSAEEMQARADFEASIASAPAQAIPAPGLQAAISAAQSLPATGGTWNELTARPFINDPINRGQNFGVGWHFVSGRMTAFTSSGSTLYAGAPSGGVWRTNDNGKHWTAVSNGLPRLPVGALATNRSDGSVWVGTGEANNASENQYGVGTFRLARGSSTWTRVGGQELNGAGIYRISWIHGYVYAATSHGLYRRSASASSSAAWRVVLKPDPNPFNSPYRTSFITDVIAVPGTGGRRIMAVDGWAGYSTPAAIRYNGFYVGSGKAGSFHRIKPSGDINPHEIGRTSLSSSGGWLYAVVQDTATDSLVGEGAFVSKSGNPAGPWQTIATSDQLANSDSALAPPNADLTSYFPGVQADYNQYILADPHNRRHVYLGLEEVYETVLLGGGRQRPGRQGLLGRHAGQRRVVLPHRHEPSRAGLHRGRRRHDRRSQERPAGGRGVRVPRHVHDDRRGSDVDGDLPVVSDRDRSSEPV